MITFLLALLAVFTIAVVGMLLAVILDPGTDLPVCPDCGEPHDQDACEAAASDCDCCWAIDHQQQP